MKPKPPPIPRHELARLARDAREKFGIVVIDLAKVENLSERDEHRKILFLITDANGYVTDNMKHLQRVADKLGILLVAIGIGNTQVKECFTHAENVRNASDLASASFNKLLKELQ